MENQPTSRLAYKYTLSGIPSSYSKTNFTRDIGWSAGKETQLIHRITLQTQHDNRPVYAERLYVKFDFHFISAIGKKNFNVKVPPILDLCRYIVELGTGIIWMEAKNIIKLDTEKHLGNTHKTEITVMPIKGQIWQKIPKIT